MNLRVLSVVELESAEAASWYDDLQPGLGDDFLNELQKAFERIRAAPRELSRSENYSGTHEIRRCRLERFPYLVVYLFRSEEVLVVAVTHVRRRPFYWLDRLK